MREKLNAPKAPVNNLPTILNNMTTWYFTQIHLTENYCIYL